VGRVFWDTATGVRATGAAVRVGLSDRLHEAALAMRTLSDGAFDPVFGGTSAGPIHKGAAVAAAATTRVPMRGILPHPRRFRGRKNA
jgi:hypothetical protein